MESLPVSSSSLVPIENHLKTHKRISKTDLSPSLLFRKSCKTQNTVSFLIGSEKIEDRLSAPKTACFLKIPCSQFANCLQNHLSVVRRSYSLRILPTHLSNPLKCHLSIDQDASFLKTPATRPQQTVQKHLSMFEFACFLLLVGETVPLPSFAAESDVLTEQASDKINIESILISIDNFFNRYPFFVASVTFVWLVVIPLIQDYLKKFKYISAIDAFRKLKDDPNAQLLDVRDEKSLLYLRSPNLKILKKGTVQVKFVEGEEDKFVKEVLMNFGDPGNTILCILDNFDGNSLKVAELLFKNGFKEAYAVKGGLRGKDGWQEVQESLLPPSVHVYLRKKGKGKTAKELGVNGERTDEKRGNNMAASARILLDGDKPLENGYIKPTGTAPQANLGSEQPLSPYPNYPDMKPPSSPTPSKPN